MVKPDAVQNDSLRKQADRSESARSGAYTVQLSGRERLLLRDAERIRYLREAYWEALTHGPKYEAVRLQDELRLAQHRMRERATAR